MNLVIVESPAKGKTIKKFLGPKYRILASFGHVRDLPEKEFGVDIENDFRPHYVIIPRSKKVISFLKKEAGRADNLILATDFDREGESIAWHLIQVLNGNLEKKGKKIERITFTEITKEALKKALKKPRNIDMSLVGSQQARRILDRLVGYKLSPLLWKKVASGLSAGRVQSVAVRLIVEQEEEIENFVPQEFWQIKVRLKKKNKKETPEFEALLIKKDEKPVEKLSIKTEREAARILDDLKGAIYQVKEIQKESVKKYPPPPFITSTLQQEAFKRLGFSAKKTMFLAQSLYERGLITYHRTDSTNLSQLALNSIRKYIKENFGKNYLPEKARIYKTRVLKAQEAHEAIRPTYIKNSKFEIRNSKLTEEHQKLYDLIWRRTLSCQMKEADFEKMSVDIKAKNYLFRAEGQTIQFDGFLQVYPLLIKEFSLPPLQINEILKLIKLLKEQHFTQPPKRYTEATLIKALEREGIGRPSTYAPIIETIEQRNYVTLKGGYFWPQEIGIIVTDLLKKHFPDIIDISFTAKMEDQLDKIAEGEIEWAEVLTDFWNSFSKNLVKKEKELSKKDLEEKTSQICEKCGKPMVVKFGKFGKFLSCSGFPQCKNARPLVETDEAGVGKKMESQISGQNCPKCGGRMVVKEGRYGLFLACENYPKCKTTKPIIKKIGMKCPECKTGDIIERRTSKGKVFWGCTNFPKCRWASWEKPKKKKL